MLNWRSIFLGPSSPFTDGGYFGMHADIRSSIALTSRLLTSNQWCFGSDRSASAMNFEQYLPRWPDHIKRIKFWKVQRNRTICTGHYEDTLSNRSVLILILNRQCGICRNCDRSACTFGTGVTAGSKGQPDTHVSDVGAKTPLAGMVISKGISRERAKTTSTQGINMGIRYSEHHDIFLSFFFHEVLLTNMHGTVQFFQLAKRSPIHFDLRNLFRLWIAVR